MVKLKFEEVLEILKARHSTTLTGTSEWIDWDAIYSDLLDEGYDPQDAYPEVSLPVAEYLDTLLLLQSFQQDLF